jgi:hypothetical protein
MSDALFDTAQRSKVTAFKPGFRMLVGNSGFNNREQARSFRQLTYTCMENSGTRAPESLEFPKTPCRVGIMANHRFPTCWDGVNLDSPNHQDHVSYPEIGTFESGGKCPSTHPVRIPQLMLETVWDTRSFNNKADWPADGQPFVWASGDTTGFSTHADYLFGWKDDSLQKAMDAHTYVSAPMLKSQSIAEQNKCTVPDMVNEVIDGCTSHFFSYWFFASVANHSVTQGWTNFLARTSSFNQQLAMSHKPEWGFKMRGRRSIGLGVN